jgi:hypothetical protein
MLFFYHCVVRVTASLGRSFWLLAINDGQIAMVPIASVQAYIDYPNKFLDVRYKAQCYDKVHSSFRCHLLFNSFIHSSIHSLILVNLFLVFVCCVHSTSCFMCCMRSVSCFMYCVILYTMNGLICVSITIPDCILSPLQHLPNFDIVLILFQGAYTYLVAKQMESGVDIGSQSADDGDIPSSPVPPKKRRKHSQGICSHTRTLILCFALSYLISRYFFFKRFKFHEYVSYFFVYQARRKLMWRNNRRSGTASRKHKQLLGARLQALAMFMGPSLCWSTSN